MTDEDEPESPINLEGPAVEPEFDNTHHGSHSKSTLSEPKSKRAKNQN